MTNTVDRYKTAHIKQSNLGSHSLLLYLNSSVPLDNYLQQTTLADDIFRCIFVSALMVKLIRVVSAKTG